MGIGYLTFNTKYIYEHHPTRKWPDEEENFAVVFQFDPGHPDIELSPPWSIKDVMTDELNADWEYGKDAEPEMRTLQLRFDDNFKYAGSMELLVADPAVENSVKHALTKTTVESIKTIEAMALPIAADFLVVSAYQKARNYLGSFLLPAEVSTVARITRSIVDSPYLRPVGRTAMQTFVAFNPLTYNFMDYREKRDRIKGAEAWLERRRDWAIGAVIVPQEKRVSYTFKRTEWHEPRPLYLYLGSTEPWKCFIKDMSIDILRFSTVSGNTGSEGQSMGAQNPSAAVVALNLAEWRGTENTGLFKDMTSSEDNKAREAQYNAAVAQNKLVTKTESDYQAIPGKEKISTQRITNTDIPVGRVGPLNRELRR